MTLIPTRFSSLKKNGFISFFHSMGMWHIGAFQTFVRCFRKIGYGEGYGICCIVNGCVLPFVWFPKGVPVNADNYLELFRNVLWPSVDEGHTPIIPLLRGVLLPARGSPTPAYCVRECFDFLLKCFPDRVISRRTNIPWPAYSRNLIPLDFWFWGDMETVLR